MYEWLEEEIASIKTPKFHLVKASVSEAKDNNSEGLLKILPPSYLEFRVKFGAAKLYRYSNHYQVIIAGTLNQVTIDENESLVSFGFSSSHGYAYFLSSLLRPNLESPVFEYDPDDGGGPLTGGIITFDEWLSFRCEDARISYSDKKWQQILDGPPPFTAEERLIVEARNQFVWHVIGVSANGDIQILVRNNSQITIPFLSLGVRARDGSINGSVRLTVKDIEPGQERVIERDCYKDLIAPDEIVVFSLPDPNPEDRDVYWEFKKLK